MSGHKMYRSNSSSSLVAWSSHSPLSRTYSVSDISTYASASDYFKKRWSTAYNPYHYSRKAYHWPHHRHTALFPMYSLHENTRYYYESPFYTRAPTCSPAWSSPTAPPQLNTFDSIKGLLRQFQLLHVPFRLGASSLALLALPAKEFLLRVPNVLAMAGKHPFTLLAPLETEIEEK